MTLNTGSTELNASERDLLQRLLSNPLMFPDAFKNWMTDHMAVNIPQLPITQALGGRGIARYLNSNADSVTVTNSGGTEETLYTTNVAGRTMGQTGQLKVTLVLTAESPDVSNALTIRLKLGGTTLNSFIVDTDTLDGTPKPAVAIFTVFNAGDYAVQYTTCSGTFVTGTTVSSSTVDTSTAQDLTITGQWTSADTNDILVKKYAAVEVFNPIGV